MDKENGIEKGDKFRQSNHLTKARYDFSVHEKRIIYHTVRALQGQIDAGVTEDLFKSHLEVFIPIGTLRKTDENDNVSRDYYKASRSLRQRSITVKGGHFNADKWIEAGFINHAEFDIKKGLLVEISKYALPYMADLTKGYTSLSNFAVFTLKSKYSQRFYEWCCMWRKPPEGFPFGWFEFTPDQLNEMFQSNHPAMYLKRNVIDEAKNEIAALYEAGQCDVSFDYTEERGGRGRGGSIKKWKFRVFSKERAAKEQEDFTKKSWPKVHGLLTKAFGDKKRDLVQKTYNELERRNLIDDYSTRVDDILSDYESGKIKNLGGYVRTSIRDRYEITVK